VLPTPSDGVGNTVVENSIQTKQHENKCPDLHCSLTANHWTCRGQQQLASIQTMLSDTPWLPYTLDQKNYHYYNIRLTDFFQGQPE